MATATAGTMVMVMVMGVAGATKTGRNTDLNSRVKSKPVATSARSLSATGSARWLRGTRPASDSAGRISLVPPLSHASPFAFHSDALGTPAAGTTRDRIGCSWNLSPAKAVITTGL